MKTTTTLFLIFLTLYSCVGTRDCTECYSSVRLLAVTKDTTNREKIYGYFRTFFPKDNLIFVTELKKGYDPEPETCKTITMINSIINDSILLTCNSNTIIGNDTIPANKNLFKYFNFIEKDEFHYVFEFDKNVYKFPKFSNKNNTFKINVKATDRILTDSCVIRFE